VNWQPIATAPHNQRILAYIPGGTYFNGYVYEEKIAIIYWWEGDEVNRPGWIDGCFCFPSHWMPLPEPPIFEHRD